MIIKLTASQVEGTSLKEGQEIDVNVPKQELVEAKRYVPTKKFKDIDSMVKEITELTDNNNHGEVLEVIANYFGYKKYENLFIYINELHNLEGSLPMELNDYRYRLSQEMYQWLKRDQGEEIYNLVRSGL